MSAIYRSITWVVSAHRPARLAPILAGLLLSALGGGRAAAEAAPATVNRIVLQVNDKIATLRDYEEKLAARRTAISQAQGIDEADRRRAFEGAPRDVAKSLFEDMLMLSRADQLRIRAERSEIDAMLAQIREANNLASDEEFKRALEQAGLTERALREQLSNQSRMREVVGREVYAKIKLEEDDLRIFYRDHPELFQVPEERRLREVVVLDTSPLSAEARAHLAEEIARRANAGEELEAIVAEAQKNGQTTGVVDLDWIKKGDLDPALEAAVDPLTTGGASQPVPARGGLHVLQLVSKIEGRVRAFDEVKGEIDNRERERLISKEFPKYLAELEGRSYIIDHLPPEAAGFRKGGVAIDPSDPLNAFRKPATPEKP